MVMTQQDSDALRKITDKHKQSRQHIHSETEKQWHILEELRESHARLVAWLANHKQPKQPIAIAPTIATRRLTPEQDEIASMETILHPITPLPIAPAERIVYHHSCADALERLQQHQPVTGDIPVNKQAKQTNKPMTTTYQDELCSIQSDQKELVKECKDAITKRYQENFSQIHPGQAFFKDPQCMPESMEISAWNWITLSPLLVQDPEDPRKQYFPGTHVRVVGNKDLNDDQIICR